MTVRALVGLALGALMALALAPTALGVTITEGDIVVNDTLTGQVVRVDPATGATTPIVTIASFPIQGIAVEADGKILVCGRGAGGGPGDFAKVIRIDPVTGSSSVLTSGNLLSQPLDVDVAADGEIYAVDTVTAGKVVRIDPASGAQTLIAATPASQAPGTLAAPRGIAVEDGGTLLVANRNTLDPGVLRFDPAPGATPTTVASGEPPFELPHGIAVEGDGDIVVADPFVAPVAPGAQPGALIRVAPSGGATSTFMNGFAPLGVAVEIDGTLAIVSSGNPGVSEVDPATGARTTLTPGITPTAIDVARMNRPPVAADDTYDVEAGDGLTVGPDGVLGNDSDPDGDDLTAALVDGPAAGTLDLDPDGGFSYTPPAGFTGDVTFTYRASDGQATSDPATVTLRVRDTIAPTVTIAQAAGQADPTSTSPIDFEVLFSEPVTGFAAEDVQLAGSAGGSLTASVAGSGAGYTVAVSGMSGPGTVVAGLPAGAAQDAAGNPSQASTSDDNTVTFQPTMNAPPTIAVVPQDSVCDPRSLTAQVRLAVTDAETPAGSLVVSALSSNQNLLPDGRILVQGTGTARTVSVLPVPGRTGTSTVTAKVSDGTSQTNLPMTVSVDGSGPGNLAGTAGTDVLLGGLGADRLSGLAGPDLLCGGLGSDRLTGGPGPDRFSGGGGGGDTAVDLTPGDGDTQDGTIP